MDNKQLINVFTSDFGLPSRADLLNSHSYLSPFFHKFFDKVSVDYVMNEIMAMDKRSRIDDFPNVVEKSSPPKNNERNYEFDPTSLLTKCLDQVLKQEKQPDSILITNSINKDFIQNMLCHYIEKCMIDIVLLSVALKNFEESCSMRIRSDFIRNLFDIRTKDNFCTLYIIVGNAQYNDITSMLSKFFDNVWESNIYCVDIYNKCLMAILLSKKYIQNILNLYPHNEWFNVLNTSMKKVFIRINICIEIYGWKYIEYTDVDCIEFISQINNYSRAMKKTIDKDILYDFRINSYSRAMKKTIDKDISYDFRINNYSRAMKKTIDKNILDNFRINPDEFYVGNNFKLDNDTSLLVRCSCGLTNCDKRTTTIKPIGLPRDKIDEIYIKSKVFYSINDDSIITPDSHYTVASQQIFGLYSIYNELNIEEIVDNIKNKRYRVLEGTVSGKRPIDTHTYDKCILKSVSTSKYILQKMDYYNKKGWTCLNPRCDNPDCVMFSK